MTPVQSMKRVSDPPTAMKRTARLNNTTATPARTDRPADQSPAKRMRRGITLAQKQALIENLKLELTERARRLRAQYNLQAQGLRTRVEIRVNRIPTSLRRLRMGDLLAKHILEQQQRKAASPSKPPAVAIKDLPPLNAASPQKSLFGPLLETTATAPPPRSAKRKSDHIGRDKENVTALDSPKKRMRAAPAGHKTERAGILSPASSNSRILPRAQEQKLLPTPKPQASRPASPVKAPAATLPASGRAANMPPTAVDKAKGARTVSTTTAASTASAPPPVVGHSAPRTAVRKATAPIPVPVAPPPSRSGTSSWRDGRRVSDSSQDSSGSGGSGSGSSTNGGGGDRKRPASRAPVSAAPAPNSSATKRTVMGTIRKGVAGATAARKAAAPKVSTASAGRVLRRRA